MTDFEARREPYKNWSNEKRRDPLNQLLDIASRYVPEFIGFSDNARDLSGKQAFRDAYESNLVKAMKEAVKNLGAPDSEPITMVFARHEEIKAEWIGRYFDHFKYWAGDRLQMGGFGDPAPVCPLQVADISAYEF